MSEPKAKHSDTPWETYGAVGIWSPTGKECVAEASEPKPKETYVHHEEVEVWSEGFRKACANARHICLCVNTHERLVEALRGTLHDLTELRIMADGLDISSREIRLLHNLIDGRINGIKSALSEIEKGGAE